MYRLLIVDDEKEIRSGLATLSWESMGIEVAGCCAHGMEALQFLSEQPVDIVLMDIRMPFMDGIELMEVLKRRYPFTKIIILSGHSDFEYAQKAIQNGAADFLLKPVRYQSIAKAFQDLIVNLEAEKQLEFRKAVLERKEKLLTQFLREDFLNRLFHNSMNPDEIEQASSEGEVLLDSACYTVAVSRLDQITRYKQNVSERELRLITYSLDNILQDLWDSKDIGYHWVNKDNAEFYLLSKKQDPYNEFEAVLHQLVRFTGLFKSTLSMGIGKTVQCLADIRSSAESAELTLHMLRKEASISLYREDLCTKWGNNPNPSPPSVSSDEKYENKTTDNLILMQAKQFILENYHRSITLKEVAAQVYLSPGHLSALFRETGETYLKFLTSLRIQKAIELLTNIGNKVYEVMEMVGYSDPAYFSEVFKKYTGKTPNEFRGIMK